MNKQTYASFTKRVRHSSPVGSGSVSFFDSETCSTNGKSISCKISCNALTPPRSRMNRVQVIGNGNAEVKIYPLRRKQARYRSYQICWYEMGECQTKTLSDPLKSKSFAQQVHVSLLNQGRAVEVTPQDISSMDSTTGSSPPPAGAAQLTWR